MKHNFHLRSVLLLLIVVISFCSCSSSSSNEDDIFMPEKEQIKEEQKQEEIKSLTVFQRQTISYFKDIALGFETGSASKVIRRWSEPMKIYAYGEVSTKMDSTLNAIILEINELTGENFTTERVDTIEESNYELYVGPYTEFIKLYPQLENQATQNWGIFSLQLNVYEITSGVMMVDTERPNLVEQQHLLREELTQSLGLAQDSAKYFDSIFQIEWTRVTEYSQIDKELIQLLYHPDMKLGLDVDEVGDLLSSILLAE